MSMKNPLAPAGIEPATFQFVARRLKHCATLPRSPKSRYRQSKNPCVHVLFPKYFVKQFQICRFAFQRDIVNQIIKNVGVIRWTYVEKCKVMTKERLYVLSVGFFF